MDTMDLASFGLGLFTGFILGAVAAICVGIFCMEEIPHEKN